MQHNTLRACFIKTPQPRKVLMRSLLIVLISITLAATCFAQRRGGAVGGGARVGVARSYGGGVVRGGYGGGYGYRGGYGYGYGYGVGLGYAAPYYYSPYAYGGYGYGYGYYPPYGYAVAPRVIVGGVYRGGYRSYGRR